MKMLNQLAIAGLFGTAAMIAGCATESIAEKTGTPTQSEEDITIQVYQDTPIRPLSSFCTDIDTVKSSGKFLNDIQAKMITLLGGLSKDDFAMAALLGNTILRGEPTAFGEDTFPEMCIIYPGMEAAINQVRPGRLDKTIVISLVDWLKANDDDAKKNVVIDAARNTARNRAIKNLSL